MEKPLRVGVIGVGAMGRNHARIYSQLPGVKLVAIADVDEALAISIAQSYGCKAYVDYANLLEENLDAISIAVPTTLHKKIALDAINRGISLLIEKPIASTVADAHEIIEAMQQKGVKLMVGHIERFNPIVPVIRKSMKGTEVISINITRVGPFPPRIKDSGVISDLAIHDIDLARYLTCSEFKKVHSLVSRTNLTRHENGALLSFEMENGVLVQLTANWLTPFKVREISVATREKFIRGWFQEQKVLEFMRWEEDNSYVVRELPVPFAEPLKLEMEAFIRAVREGSEPPISGYDGLIALRIAETCVNKASK